jgi:hypothetical protein
VGLRHGTDQSTLYKADGSKQGLKVAIPGGAPTGTVSNTDASDPRRPVHVLQ